MGTEAKLIDHIDMCRILGVKPDTWRKRIKIGTAPLPFSQMGSRTYYRIADLRHYLKQGAWPARMKFRAQQEEEAQATG